MWTLRSAIDSYSRTQKLHQAHVRIAHRRRSFWPLRRSFWPPPPLVLALVIVDHGSDLHGPGAPVTSPHLVNGNTTKPYDPELRVATGKVHGRFPFFFSTEKSQTAKDVERSHYAIPPTCVVSYHGTLEITRALRMLQKARPCQAFPPSQEPKYPLSFHSRNLCSR